MMYLWLWIDRKMIEKTQRQIHDVLAKSGKNGLDISYLKEMIKFRFCCNR